MTITYRTAGAWGAGKGSNLTAAEADQNFYGLDQRVVDLETNGVSAVSVSNIVVTGGLVTFYMSDGSDYGPFALPVTNYNYRGEWSALTAYAAYDVVMVTGTGAYIVLNAHISDAAFDADAMDSSGEFYGLLVPDNSTQGVLTIADSSLILSASHANKYLRCTTGCTVIVPTGIAATGTLISIRQSSIYSVHIEAGGGVTINFPTGFEQETVREGGMAFLKCVGTNEWDLWGDLAENQSA